MFQPQPTQYSPFSPYGITNSVADFPGFQSSGGLGPASYSGGPLVFRNPGFQPVNTHASAGVLNYNNTRQHFKMEATDLEQQEALARDYQPNLQGALVGEKKSSHAIAEAYAKADPVYVAKTAALPQTYSHYRPILGDGNCGWRAIGFAYFETLLRLGDVSQVEAEVARLMSLNNILSTMGGFDVWLFEDMVEQTTDLLKDLAASIHDPQAAVQILIERWNEDGISMAMIYHLRMLASSWLKGHPENYIGFIPGNNGIQGYCKNTLEPSNTEIDHLGMSLLIDVLLKPIGFAVEIVYLDRSEGSQVNTHMFQAEDANGIPTNPDGPVIHLLFRPDHYDVLYRDRSSSTTLQQPISEAIRNSNLQVNRATSFSQQHSVQHSIPTMHNSFNQDMTVLLGIPGFVLPPASSHHPFQSTFSPIEQAYTASPVSASISPVSPGPSSTASNLSLSTTFAPQQSSSLTSPTLNTPLGSHSPHSTFPTITQLPIHSHNHQQPHPIRPSLSTHPSMSCDGLPSSSFRPSKYEWAAAADFHEPVVFQTSTFKNSHYNTAHYNNPNFQPEEWNPEYDEPAMNGARKKSS